MAKKSAKTDRQAVIDQVRKQQRRADKRRNYAIVGVCALIAVTLIALAAYRPIKDWYDLRQFRDLALADIGAAASVCGEVTTEPANGSSEHVPTGQQVTYEDSPPAFGPHWNELNVAPAPLNRKFYTSDRPELESLVHNLEHGYTILWYDDTVADDSAMLNTIDGIADKFRSDEDNFRNKFIAAPWTSEDGEPFPDGQSIAFTHWSVGGEGSTDPATQVGVWQYCSEPSGEALETFMLDYPYTDSPEPNAF